jgi:PEP-CTERM motif-containing protein
MRRFALALCVGFVGASGLLASSPVNAATVFDFQFDNQGINGSNLGTDGPLVGPIVGSGTLTSSVDLAPGTYDLSSLLGATLTLDLSFIDGTSFSGLNVTTPPTGIALRIEDAGSSVERLFFTESGGIGSDGGPFGGALDFLNGGQALSFEPSGSGGNFLYGEGGFIGGGEGGLAGRYLALSAVPGVPEPSTWATMLIGFGAIGAASRRRRRNSAFATA